MKILENIRNLYVPIQPTVRQSGNAVTYREIIPHLELQPFIYCYWQLKTTSPLQSPFLYRVVADGCIDIFFELNNVHESFVMGFCKQYTAFELGNDFNYVGVRFLPTMFPQLFNKNASEISNQSVGLNLILPAISEFIKNTFLSNHSLLEIKNKWDEYLLELIVKNDFNSDHRLYDAIDLILEHKGMVQVENELKTGISPRQLRRLFKYYIGDTPKTFSKVVRFQNILRAKPSTQSLKKNKLFYDIGYYDQAHFIKDFKNFYGVTPSQAFGR